MLDLTRYLHSIYSIETLEDGDIEHRDLEIITVKQLFKLDPNAIILMVFKISRHMKSQVNDLLERVERLEDDANRMQCKVPLESWKDLSLDEKIEVIDYLVKNVREELTQK